MKRSSGILMPISSLPSEYGIGCFSKSAYDFVDFLHAASQKYWQILPIGPTGYGDSPYQSFSSFAGNPYFIDLDELVGCGLLTKEECTACDFGDNPAKIDYEKQYKSRYPLLKKAYKRSQDISENPKYSRFVSENAFWLEDYSLFMAIKDAHGGLSFNLWEDDFKLHTPDGISKAYEMYAFDIGFYKFLQYHFHRQWHKLREYAHSKGIEIIGDIPIYVSPDSADVWQNPALFQLDESLNMTALAGCPPDGFSPTGQLWGNPLYDWEYHKRTGFEWWLCRLKHAFSLYDIVRIDHFRGFEQYYSIPCGAENASFGHWEVCPGRELFEKFKRELPDKEVISEDLGFITDSVKELVRDCGFYGMKVLQFAFDPRDTGSKNDYLPHNYQSHCIAYTGTHDNQTLLSWYEAMDADTKAHIRGYLCDSHTPENQLNYPLISLIMRSPAVLCIVPLQDYLLLGDESRINTPSTLGENWRWRLENLPEGDIAEKIRRLTAMFGRA